MDSIEDSQECDKKTVMPMLARKPARKSSPNSFLRMFTQFAQIRLN
ncbi:hypothetical protein RE6C_04118 [Rhodopirellula europaea 6C]|uniref:Uncharacterized protein n=1 Tax=Rhodopirellula europaea 6C TaxID=1263867 RepID=M2A547_9BACT|nr:hypothetical protein RE6C_04118 [Rhodopirellula europaea 6C]